MKEVEKNSTHFDSQVGEQCQALWHKDGNYYEATVSEITTDGDVQVKFRHNGQSGVTSLGLLKISKHGIRYSPRSRIASQIDLPLESDISFVLFSGTKTSTSRKEQQEREREHAKRRKQKKLERFKNLEKEGEKGKNKWQNFSNKVRLETHSWFTTCSSKLLNHIISGHAAFRRSGRRAS